MDHKRGDRPNGGDCDEQQQSQEIFVHDRELSVVMFDSPFEAIRNKRGFQEILVHDRELSVVMLIPFVRSRSRSIKRGFPGFGGGGVRVYSRYLGPVTLPGLHSVSEAKKILS